MRVPEKWTPLLRQSFVSAGVTLNFAGHACVVAFPAILIPSLRSPESAIQVTKDEESWISSILAMGVIAGNIVITPLMEIFGRKKSHLFTLAPQLIGWIILYFATNFTELIISRVLQGLSMGLTASLGTIIIGETAHPKYRGVMLSFISLAFAIGNLFAHTLGTFVTWRQATLICCSNLGILLIVIIFSPETPPWLIRKGRYDEAKQIFFWLRSQTAENEMELEKIIAAQKIVLKSNVEGQNLSLFQRTKEFFNYLGTAFKKPEFYKPVAIATCSYSLFQFGGLNVVSSYGLDIINELVGPESNKEMLMVALDVERLICNILAIFLMKVLKRRTFLLTSGIICILTYLAKAFYLYAKRENFIPVAYDSQWIPIFLIAIYLSVATTLGTLGLSIPGEIMPLQYRGLGGGLSALIGLSLSFFISLKCFPVLMDAVGLPLTYCIYACVVGGCLLVNYLLMPETKDRTLQDIEDSFKNHHPEPNNL